MVAMTAGTAAHMAGETVSCSASNVVWWELDLYSRSITDISQQCMDCKPMMYKVPALYGLVGVLDMYAC